MIRHSLGCIRVAVAFLAVSVAACSNPDFPIQPTPQANANVTTLGGGSWSGTVMLGNGSITSFNMTLVARGLAATTGAPTQAQAPGTVEVSGNYDTGSGLSGTVRGSLQGTLQNGVFQGVLESNTPSCLRPYAGPITESSAALVPSGDVPVGCPLTFSVQLSRERGPDCLYSISVDRQSFSGTGGDGTATVETGDGCTWAAESPNPWIQVDTAPRVGRGTVVFRVVNNGEGARDGQLRFSIPNQRFTIRQGAGCVLTVSTATATVATGGGSGTVRLEAPTACEWTAQSGVDWISVSPANGTGPATITFTARPNAGLGRQGTFSVGGNTVTVTQGVGCTLSVTPQSATVPMGGGTGTVAVGGVRGCAWTAQSNVDWLVVSPATAAGDGDGTVSYTVQANVGLPRQGILTIANQLVTITQGTCTSPVTVSLSLSNVAAGGGTGTMAVSAATGCPWTVQSSVPWITVSAPGGVGNANLTLTVLPNPGAARQGTITVAGQAFTITQDALVCIYELRPLSILPLPAAPFGTATTGTMTVNAPAGCAWTLTVEYPDEDGDEVDPWLTLLPSPGSGTAVVTYIASQNTAIFERTATIRLTAGTTTLPFTVTQDGATEGILNALPASSPARMGGTIPTMGTRPPPDR